MTSVWQKCHTLTMICYSSGTIEVGYQRNCYLTRIGRTQAPCNLSPGAELIAAESLWGRDAAPGTEYDCREGNRVFVSNRRQGRGLAGRFAHQRTHISRQAPRPDGVRLPITIEKPCLDVHTPFQRSK